MMIVVAVVALIMAAIMTAPWLILLVLITLPQTLIVAACSLQASRDGARRRADDQPAARSS
jgi:hypothetical protein